MAKYLFSFSILFLTQIICNHASASVPDEKRLRDDLLHVYNWTVRPVKNFSDRFYVRLRFKLNRVAELDLKDQLLTLNVVIEQEWNDYKFKWDPESYGGITHLNLPSASIWRPDFQLYNQFGDFEMVGPFADVYFNGLVKWSPSAILRTFCLIEVRCYPFDIQKCFLKFGSWTYDGNLLYLQLADIPLDVVEDINTSAILPVGMTLKDYYPSVEWDLLSIPAEFSNNYYTCCPEPYPSILFNVTLRRHPHYYLVNLVMPLVALSYLSLLVFYLPADSGEKITLCVSVLTCQTMFLLLMMDSIPVTSLAVPLLGKIIVFNMILVFLSLLCTTFVLNVYYRKPSTHDLPNWVRRIRYTVIPKLLLMEAIPSSLFWRHNKSTEEAEENEYIFGQMESGGRNWDSGVRLKKVSRLCSISLFEIDSQMQRQSFRANEKYSKEDIKKALGNVSYVRNYMERLEKRYYECEDWKFLAAILDRIFLLTFNIAFITGTIYIMMDAEALFDKRKAVDKTLRHTDNVILTAVEGDDASLANDTDTQYESLLTEEVIFDE